GARGCVAHARLLARLCRRAHRPLDSDRARGRGVLRRPGGIASVLAGEPRRPGQRPAARERVAGRAGRRLRGGHPGLDPHVLLVRARRRGQPVRRAFGHAARRPGPEPDPARRRHADPPAGGARGLRLFRDPVQLRVRRAARGPRRRRLRLWNFGLVITAFLLVVFGTFIVRSGVVPSVHTFAISAIGPWFFGFLVVCLLFSALLLTLRSNLGVEAKPAPAVSREGAFV